MWNKVEDKLPDDDMEVLLIAETDCGIKESTLFDRTSLFGFSFYFARKKLIRRIKNQKIVLC